MGNYFDGYFDNEIETARAYDKAAKKYHGEFAHLNFPEDTEDTDQGMTRTKGSHR